MGNGGGSVAPADASRQVYLGLDGVQSVDHLPEETYYALASIHDGMPPSRVTAETPALFQLKLDSVVTVRIFLLYGDSEKPGHRVVGQVHIPVREMLATCGTGIYKTWLVLEEPRPFSCIPREQLTECFSRSLHGMPLKLDAPRVCITLMEASISRRGHGIKSKDWEACYGPLLVSHQQCLRAVHAYFEHLEMHEEPPESDYRWEAYTSQGSEGWSSERPVCTDADQITMVTLAEELERLQDEEEPLLLRKRVEAEARLNAAKQQRAQLLREWSGRSVQHGHPEGEHARTSEADCASYEGWAAKGTVALERNRDPKQADSLLPMEVENTSALVKSANTLQGPDLLEHTLRKERQAQLQQEILDIAEQASRRLEQDGETILRLRAELARLH